VLSELSDFLLRRSCLLGLLEGLIELFLDLALGASLKEPMNLLFHFFQLVFWRLLFLLLYWLLDSCSLSSLVGPAIEPSRSIGFHGSTKSLGCGAFHGGGHVCSGTYSSSVLVG
jgi:hypothetical protein